MSKRTIGLVPQKEYASQVTTVSAVQHDRSSGPVVYVKVEDANGKKAPYFHEIPRDMFVVKDIPVNRCRKLALSEEEHMKFKNAIASPDGMRAFQELKKQRADTTINGFVDVLCSVFHHAKELPFLKAMKEQELNSYKIVPFKAVGLTVREIYDHLVKLNIIK